MSKIIILYARYGDGHVQVSKALQQCFLEKGAHARMIDLYAKAHPVMDAVTRFAYLKSSSYSPMLYGLSYYLTQNMRYDRTPAKWLNTFGIGALKSIIRTERPDAVINTFPMQAMAEIRKQTGMNIPIFNVLTDFVLHDRWIHPEINKFFVANEDLKRAIITKGIPAGNIKVSGIPLRKAFLQPYDKTDVFERYSLNPAPKFVLLMAGAYGVFHNLKKICQALLELNNVQVLLVCGRNEPLKEKLEASFAHDDNIRIFGFVEHIQELMAISSCIITKAGGITLSEALALQLPVIVFRPLPGQERENALFLAKQGKALLAYQIEDVVENVEWLLEKERQSLGNPLDDHRLHTGNATETIVGDILHEIELWNKKIMVP